MRLLPIAAMMLLAACPDPKDDGDGDGIGDDIDTANGDIVEDSGGESCLSEVTGVSPADGTTDVYYRDTLRVDLDGDVDPADVSITLTDASGADVPYTLTWADNNVQAQLDLVLAPSTTYALSATACDTSAASTFTTSALGSPLEIDAATLQGRTYVFRLSDAAITEPEFLDFVADTYLTVPLLLGVTAVDETSIDLLGAMGNHENDGSYVQIAGQSTWDFPVADFTQSPYFEAETERVVLTYRETLIPIEQFDLSGTFTADGTSIQEGYATGLGDTRHMAELLGQNADEYGAVCTIAESAGVYCEPCADGENYCLFIVAENITARWEEGLALTVVE